MIKTNYINDGYVYKNNDGENEIIQIPYNLNNIIVKEEDIIQILKNYNVNLDKINHIKYLPYLGYLALLPAIGFAYIYITKSRQTGLEVFGEKIRMYSLNYDSNTTIEISTEDILIANQAGEDESVLLYEIRKRIELYNGLPHRVGHINSIRPFMDAALIDFYLKEVPTEMRMSNALFREDDSMLVLLPYMLCRV
jgi:hypothetical protein